MQQIHQRDNPPPLPLQFVLRTVKMTHSTPYMYVESVMVVIPWVGGHIKLISKLL